MSVKTLDDYFTDWESHVFGFGYGTGEPHVVDALNAFMEAIGIEDRPHSYDYRRLETALKPVVAWLLINALCHADLIEYGTSPRYGWLTPRGEALRAYLATKTNAALLEVLNRDDDYHHCYPDHCNCDGEPCHNPFWVTQNK